MVSNAMHESVGSAFEVKLVVFTKVIMKISVYCDVQVCSQCSASGCSTHTTDLDVLTRKLQNVKDKHVDHSAKKMCTKITHSCVASVDLPWFGTNLFSKMYVYARGFGQC